MVTLLSWPYVWRIWYALFSTRTWKQAQSPTCTRNMICGIIYSGHSEPQTILLFIKYCITNENGRTCNAFSSYEYAHDMERGWLLVLCIHNEWMTIQIRPFTINELPQFLQYYKSTFVFFFTLLSIEASLLCLPSARCRNSHRYPRSSVRSR